VFWKHLDEGVFWKHPDEEVFWKQFFHKLLISRLLNVFESRIFFFELQISEFGIHVSVMDWWIQNAFFE